MSTLSIQHSDALSDITTIHNALYSFNLSRTGKERQPDVHPELFPEQSCYVVKNEAGEFCGGMVYHWLNDPRRIFVDYLFLSEECRGHGTGVALIKTIAETGKKGGAVNISLTTNDFQAPGFYQKQGFKITHTRPSPQGNWTDNQHYELELEL